MKYHAYSSKRQSHHVRQHWRLVLLTCVMLLVVPFSAAQATMEQFNQPTDVLIQPDPATTTAYLPLISTDDTDTPPPDPQAPRFEPGACPIAPPQGVEVTCGYLSVPETRQQDTDQRIQLAIMIVHATGDNPAPDPVFYLQGGPGSHAIDFTGRFVQAYAPIIERRDLIVIDQRGTGFSRPALPCPYPSFPSGQQTLAQQLGLFDTAQQDDPVQADLAMLTQCYTTLRQAGIDITAYNSVENAADLADLRQALGYETINLFGASYGTRLALTMMRDHPTALNSVVLDSVYPLQENFHVSIYASFDQALQNLFADCAADAACNAAYPDLTTVFDALVARLNTTPAEVPITDPVTGQETTVPFTGDDLTPLLLIFLYRTGFIPMLPMFISDIDQGNYELVSLILSDSGEDESNFGMYTAVQCSEDVTFATAEDFRASRAAHPRAHGLQKDITVNEVYLEVCAAWNLISPNPIENEPVASPIDTLVITGEYDPVTPPQWGALAAATLENSFIVPPYPRGGHVPSVDSPCLASIMAAFFDNPTAEPDVSCIEEEAPLPFVVDQEEAQSIIEEWEYTMSLW